MPDRSSGLCSLRRLVRAWCSGLPGRGDGIVAGLGVDIQARTVQPNLDVPVCCARSRAGRVPQGVLIASLAFQFAVERQSGTLDSDCLDLYSLGK